MTHNLSYEAMYQKAGTIYPQLEDNWIPNNYFF